MGLLLIFLIFLSPVVQIFLIGKRKNNKIAISIAGITILTIVSTIVLSLLGTVLYEISTVYNKIVIKCDMTIPGVISIDILLIIIVIPAIGLIGRLLTGSQKHDLQIKSKNNPYSGFLKNSHERNLKRANNQ